MAANSKNVLPPYHLVIAASMGASVTSAPTNVQYLDNVIYQIVFTGTPNGTFTVQGSEDYMVSSSGTVTNAGTWSTLPLSATVSASGSANDGIIDLNQLPVSWVRLVYTRASSTGTLDVYVSGKAV